MIKADDVDTARRHADYIEGLARLSRNLGDTNAAANAQRKRKLTNAELQGTRDGRLAERDIERAGRSSSLPATSPLPPNVTPISEALRGRAPPPPERTLHDDMTDNLP
ncbi:MAG: hypothetical protein M3R41_00220 [Pseudomonadota bacterium]|nr:hypothetical protein [Pseudomonadota bacterium]